MTIRNLDKVFRPQSVAVIGASSRPKSVGNIIMHNLLKAEFNGPVFPVNPKENAIAGVFAYPDISSLPMAPDLAVICTPPEPIPDIIRQLGERGTRAAIVITAGLEKVKTPEGVPVSDAMLQAAKPYLLRILGSNCLGALIPGSGLNASFSHVSSQPGTIAFVSQSGALCTAALDWAKQQDIGFSHLLSLGNMSDIDFGDAVDYLANDPSAHAILLYVEAVTHGRKFMSACRAASRNKPVIVIKSGTAPEGAAAAATHTGALAGSDRVYDAAFRRAGLLRVFGLDELFAAVETLARAKPQSGERLAILTNGGGIGVMATDELINHQGVLAKLSKKTIEQLDAKLPATWSHGNPVDIIGDASGERYANAMQILAGSSDCDAVLVMHAPTATADSVEAAGSVIKVAKEQKKNILTCWVGGYAVAPARRLFHDRGIPTYDSPKQAIQAFMHLVDYRRSQDALIETPRSVPHEVTVAKDTARQLIIKRQQSGLGMMTEPEAKAVLGAYGIPIVETHIVRTTDEAVSKATEMGFPVALKIISEQISHKSDVGGVKLFLHSEEDVRTACEHMLTTIHSFAPDAKLDGFTVQQMAIRPGAYELFMGVTEDPIFGPVIVFGDGGTGVEIIGDSAVALPPLNMKLAMDVIGETRISKLLHGYRDRPAVDMDQLCQTLIQLSQIIIDNPEIAEIDINPLLCDENGVLALDARIRVYVGDKTPDRHFAIRPYPSHLEETVTLKEGHQLLIRPIRPEDEPEHRAFIAMLTPEDIRFRFFGELKELPPSQMARFTQIDFDREMAFIASAEKPDGAHETLGVVRTITDPNNENCEFAIVVRSDLKGLGLGQILLEKMIRYCKVRGTKNMVGQIFGGNERMLELAKRLGFTMKRVPGESVIEVVLDIQATH